MKLLNQETVTPALNTFLETLYGLSQWKDLKVSNGFISYTSGEIRVSTFPLTVLNV
jgi:hypothetical protein